MEEFTDLSTDEFLNVLTKYTFDCVGMAKVSSPDIELEDCSWIFTV